MQNSLNATLNYTNLLVQTVVSEDRNACAAL